MNEEKQKLTINELIKLDVKNRSSYYNILRKNISRKKDREKILFNLNNQCVFAYKFYDDFALIFAMRLKNKVYVYAIILPSLLGSKLVMPLEIGHAFNLLDKSGFGEDAHILDDDDWNLLKNFILEKRISGKNGDTYI